jgi:hypothetical protein
MKRTKIIQFQNRKIFYCDLKGAHNEDIIDASYETWQLFNSELQEGEKAFFLIDITDVDIPAKTMEEMTSLAERYRNNIAKEGIIGMNGFNKALFNFYGWATGSHLKAFENKETAMHWLAS